MNPYIAKLKELQNKINAVMSAASDEGRAFTEEEKKVFDETQKAFNQTKEMADNWDAVNAIGDIMDAPDSSGIYADSIEVVDKKEGPFSSFAQQLSAIKAVATGSADDSTKDKVNFVNSALGMNTSVAREGGSAIQSDFAGIIMDTAVKEDPLLSLVDTYSVSAKSNSVEWVEVDEKGSVETYVFGAVRIYWAGEAAAVTATMPQLKEKKIDLHKLMGMAYVTYEMDEDAGGLVDQLYTRAFQIGIRKRLSEGVYGGTGVGQMLGFSNGAGKVEIAKETNQENATINYKNISKMYHGAINKTNGVWVMHPDCHEQLDFLEFPVGTGGVPVYLPATMDGQVDKMRGRGIIELDECSALGSAGDINFIDPNDYIMIYKGGVKKDVSIHVQFLTAQNAYRFIFRANGMPKHSLPLQIKNSSKKRSSCVSLGARS